MKVNRTVRDFENALEHLLEEQQFAHLTVDQICDEALLHRSSFYRYFHDKYDLLEHLINTRVQDIIAGSSSESDLIESGINYIDQHKKVFRNIADGGQNRTLFSELIRIVSDVTLHWSKDQPTDTIGRLIRHSNNPELLAYSISGAFMGACFWWQTKNFNVPKQEVIDFAKQAVMALSSGDKNLNKGGMQNVGND